MMMQAGNPSRPAVAGAAAVLATGLALLALHEPGPQARHMALHIVTMNVAAPLLAALALARLPASRLRPRWLWIAALAQVAALWAAHVPALQGAAAGHPLLQAALHMLLLAIAFAFWLAVIAMPGTAQWHAVAALAFSGKLFCLLAALLVFAPRALYGAHHHTPALDDQQLAGLLMIVACPLSYLVAAFLITNGLIGRTTALRAG